MTFKSVRNREYILYSLRTGEILSSNYAVIIENNIPETDHMLIAVMHFDNFSYVMYVFTRHGH